VFANSTDICTLTAVNSEKAQQSPISSSWLNRTVIGVGLTSLFSDWSHEIATAVLPAFLATIGAGPAWLGTIEGVADGLSSLTKLASGHYTDRMKHRKPLAVFGYAFTAFATVSFAFATHAYQVLFGRAAAWFGRGVRSPAKKALLAADVPPTAYGRAADFLVATEDHAPFLPHGILLDPFARAGRGGEFLAARPGAASSSQKSAVLSEWPAVFAASVWAFSYGSRDFWLW
jgi:hypothetical protein